MRFELKRQGQRRERGKIPERKGVIAGTASRRGGQGKVRDIGGEGTLTRKTCFILRDGTSLLTSHWEPVLGRWFTSVTWAVPPQPSARWSGSFFQIIKPSLEEKLTTCPKSHS